MIGATVDDKAFQKHLEGLQRRLPGIVAKALNDTTRQARDELIRELPLVFDRPTPYIMGRAIFARFTNARELAADIFISDKATKGIPPLNILSHNVYGTGRPLKSLEVRLRSVGILGADEWLVPSKYLPLDAYGNAPASLSKKLLSQLRANFDPTVNETDKSRRSRNKQRKKRGARYFIGQPGGGRKKRAIYERIETGFGSSVRPVYVITRKPQYSKRFEVFAIVKRDWNARVRANLMKRMAEVTP